MEEKNYLNRVVVIVLAVVLVLLALYRLPASFVDAVGMREIDLFADVRNDSLLNIQSDSAVAVNDSLAKLRSMSENLPILEGSHVTHDAFGNVVTVEDSIITAMSLHQGKREGVTALVDMSGDGEGGMSYFYQALSEAGSRPVRIAVLGDSFIEGDIMTSMLRELLQERFGGCGTGYLPITSITAGARRTVRQTFSGWTQHKAVDSQGYASNYNNITGNYFNASPGAWVNMKGDDTNFPRNATCNSSSFYYMGNGGVGTVTALVNGEQSTPFTLNETGGVGVVTVRGNISTVRWTVGHPAGIIYLGASMDCDRGVIVDNFGMRSGTGLHLNTIPIANLQAMHRARPYDLIVIMYGLNIAGRNQRDFTRYSNTMTETVTKLKENLPGTSLLLVSCSDREMRSSGGFKTMPGVLGLIQAQKRVTINTRIAFWDLYNAMGGEGSIVEMVSRGEAARDYTHVGIKGGERIARLLYDALMLGYDSSNQKKTE